MHKLQGTAKREAGGLTPGREGAHGSAGCPAHVDGQRFVYWQSGGKGGSAQGSGTVLVSLPIVGHQRQLWGKGGRDAVYEHKSTDET
jgi:hypothetical protein